MASKLQLSRLSVLSALLSGAVVWAALAAPDLVFLVALVSALVAVLAIFSSASAAESDPHSNSEWASDGYEILEKISEGGMGEVFRARQLELGRLVALKRIKPKRLTQEAQGRFKREARVLSSLSSPHTINVFDAGIQHEDTLYYVMELLDGLNLRQLIEREGTIPAARVIHILRQASNSLNEAHSKGLVHRDIKPANLMVCRYGGEFDFVKVLDFGLVKAVTEEPQHETFDVITHAGALPGTPAFLAPEAISGGEEGVTARADIYSLGAIGHFLLTGAHLFQAQSPVAMVRAQLHEHPPLASDKSPQQVPPALDQLLARCLEKDANQRPQSAEELLHLLEALTAEAPWTRAHAQASWEEVPAASVRAGQPAVFPNESGISG